MPQKRSSDWGLILIAIWLLINGVGLLVSQALRLIGIATYEIVVYDAGFAALDTGFVLMDLVLASPLYILAGILLWRRHRWGLILGVASLVQLAYVMCVLAVGSAQLNLWSRMGSGSLLLMLLTPFINAVAFAYLVYRYARVYPGARLE